MKWAFSDETTRGRQFVMVAAVVDTGELHRCRVRLRVLLRPGQRQLHLAKESRRRREQILEQVGRLPVEFLVARISLAGTSVRAARVDLVSRVADALIDREVAQWTLDAIDHEEEGRDRRAIAARVALHQIAEPFAYDHHESHGEPMLWAADAAAWLASGGRSGKSLRFTDVP